MAVLDRDSTAMATAGACLSSSPTLSLASVLPFDILHTLLAFTPIPDFVHFCSTCKALWQHAKNDSIWKRVCTLYGVRECAHFGGASPYAVYTQLLHPYGPLIGLWANDHPFRGGILEFRLIPGDDSEQGGIIGEIWSLPSSHSHPDRPTPPSYIRTVKISFDPPPGDNNPLRVRVFCWGPNPTANPPHLSALVRRSPTKLKHRMQFHRARVDHPNFPHGLHARWLAAPSAARLPHIPEEPEPAINDDALVSIYPATRLPAIWVGPSDISKPSAISIRCPLAQEEGCVCACVARHAPTLPFDSLDTRPPRYYPLRSHLEARAHARGGAQGPQTETDPRAEGWSLRALEGLWLGSYGPNGTECLYVACMPELADSGDDVWIDDGRNGPRKELVATKLTGDVHVPRGCVSWRLSLVEPGTHLAQATMDVWAAMHGVQPDYDFGDSDGEDEDEDVDEDEDEGEGGGGNGGGGNGGGGGGVNADVDADTSSSGMPLRVLCGQGSMAARGFRDLGLTLLMAGVMSADEIRIFWTELHEFRTYHRYTGRAGESGVDHPPSEDAS